MRVLELVLVLVLVLVALAVGLAVVVVIMMVTSLAKQSKLEFIPKSGVKEHCVFIHVFMAFS